MLKEGYVEKIIYKNDENGYAVFTVISEDGEDIFVGIFPGIQEGVYILAEGEYVKHPNYDIQFKFSSCEIKMPEDLISVERYLGSGIIKGVGEALAKRIVKKFKMDSLRIIVEEPERLAEVKGISDRKAREIAISYNEKKEMQDAVLYLTGYGIAVNLAIKIFNEYGSDMYEILSMNPYKVAEDISGVGFKTADEIAERMGISKDSDFRIRAAILYTLLNANHLGHMYLPKQMLIHKTYSLLTEEYAPFDEALMESIDNQITELQMDKRIIKKKILQSDLSQNTTSVDETIVYAEKNYFMELNSARILCDLDQEMSDISVEIDKLQVLSAVGEQLILEDKQKEAIENAINHGVAVITGGPGTGKTTTINALIKVFEGLNKTIMLTAPTGRAAKRITESTGYAAQTIHRMLELVGGSLQDGEDVHFRFGKNKDHPLETDVIIVDEMSMVDSSIFYSLLQAIMPGTRLILVGDSNQLPSVGPGNVLKDIIASDIFSVTVLDRIFRQEEESDIITNAHKIHAGIYPEIKNKSKDFFYIPRNTTEDIIAELKQLITKNLPEYFKVDAMDIQVLTPMRKYELGVDNLNKKLQEILNAKDRNKLEKERGDIVFRKGDKVMQIRNNYNMEWEIREPGSNYVKEEGIGVFNGDVGYVKDVNDFNQNVIVEFDDGRQVTYQYNQLDELEHAYAITIHKSQGSEYPVIILPLWNGPAKLLTRNLLYTAVTRAKLGVVVVGNINLMRTMIDNVSEQQRFTTFAERLKEIRSC